MGFWGRLFGRTEYEAAPAERLAHLSDPDPVPVTGDLRFVVEDTFTITGRGIVITGTVESGDVGAGDVIRVGAHEVRVTGIEAFRATLTRAFSGQMVGLLIEGPGASEVTRGDVAGPARPAGPAHTR